MSESSSGLFVSGGELLSGGATGVTSGTSGSADLLLSELRNYAIYYSK